MAPETGMLGLAVGLESLVCTYDHHSVSAPQVFTRMTQTRYSAERKLSCCCAVRMGLHGATVGHRMPLLCAYTVLRDTCSSQHHCSGITLGKLPPWLSGKNLFANAGETVQSLGQADSLEKDMATHSSILPGKFHG